MTWDFQRPTTTAQWLLVDPTAETQSFQFIDASGYSFLGHRESMAYSALAVATGAGDCGTTPAVVGNDNAGRVTVGSGANGGVCTVTFAKSWTNAPVCSVFNETSAVALRPAVSTTTLAITGALTAADVLSFQCMGYH